MFFRCLEKNPDNRPFLVELLEHPFFTELIGPTGSDHHVRITIESYNKICPSH